MFLIKPEEAKRFANALDLALLEMTDECIQVYRGLAVAMFNYVAWETPQWTGNAASNWNFSVGAPDLSADSSLKAQQSVVDRLMGIGALEKGAGEAVQIAASRNEGRQYAVTLAAPVYIANAAQELSDGTVYASYLEENPNNYLRPENEPGAMVSRGLAKAAARFALISRADTQLLKSVKFGDAANAGLR